jgi:hypothetical protein
VIVLRLNFKVKIYGYGLSISGVMLSYKLIFNFEVNGNVCGYGIMSSFKFIF